MLKNVNAATFNLLFIAATLVLNVVQNMCIDKKKLAIDLTKNE